MLPLSLLTVTDDKTGIVYYLPLEADFEDPIDLEYPLLVTSGTKVPPDRPPPYRSDNETGDLKTIPEGGDVGGMRKISCVASRKGRMARTS